MGRLSLAGSRGQGLVEFALVFPLIILIIFGVIDFGRAIYTYNTLSEGARQAGRLAVVDQTTADIQARAAAAAAAVTLDAQPNGVRICYLKSTASATDCASAAAADACNGSDPGDPSGLQIGCLALVTTQSTYRPLTPVISSLVGSIVLSSTSANSVEYVCPTATQPTCP